MKVDMSPKAIENRLRLVGELTRACLLIRQNSEIKNERERAAKKSNQKNENTQPESGKIF